MNSFFIFTVRRSVFNKLQMDLPWREIVYAPLRNNSSAMVRELDTKLKC